MLATEHDFQDVLRLLRGRRPSRSRPGSWDAFCPVHKGGQERHRSLSVSIGRKGLLLVKCHCCHAKWGEIARALGVEPRQMFPPGDPRRERRTTRSRAVQRSRIVATYPYRDEHGELLYEVVRLEPKSFYQRRPTPDGRGWINGLGTVRRVLFWLPELLASPDWPVVIVEGEKDCETLACLNLPICPTTNCGGAGMGWREEYSASLRGRRVVIIPDNDDQGREHACKVAGSLVMAGVASLRVVQLPGLPDHGDVTDWLKSGGTKEQMLTLVRGAKEWRPVERAG